MKEILPGVVHWTRVHPKIKIEVSSYYLPEEQVLIDPLMPEEGADAFLRSPQHVLLTNRHHYRDSAEFEARFGCKVWCVESGLHEFTQGEKVQGFQFGDTLPGKIEALEIEACIRVLDDVVMVDHLACERPLFFMFEPGLCGNLGAKAGRSRMKLAPDRLVGASRRGQQQRSE